MADPYYWYMKLEELRFGTELLKRGFASMQKGGVIMDVVNAEQARIAESAGAVAVMSLERVPSDIRKQGGVARMADPEKVMEIIDAVSIPVMGKVRIGHFVEAQVLEELGVDMIDESEVLTPADEEYHIDKKKFKVPFVCGARNLGEALRRVNEGAAMIRTKGEAGTGNVVEAVRHMRAITGEIRKVQGMDDQERISYARTIEAPAELVIECAQRGRLPVVNFSAGGIATPSDAALMMQLGADGVFVGSGIFKSSEPEKMAKAIVEAVNHYSDAAVIAKVSRGLGDAMPGLDVHTLRPDEVLQTRGR
jgi:pyridoxal 5'-phosphate synthase pdxS subunit